MSLKLLTPPSAYPITLAEAKLQCRIEIANTSEDTLLNSYIAAATAHIESITGRSLMTQTWQQALDAFALSMLLPRGPVQSVTNVKYYDVNNALQTLDPSFYAVDNFSESEPAWLIKADGVDWPLTSLGINNVIIQYIAGYATLPPEIKQAALLLVEHFYDNRLAVQVANGAIELPFTISALLANNKSYW